MSAIEKLIEELEKQGVKNRLYSWHESMIKTLEEAREQQKSSPVDWETVRDKYQKAAIFHDMLYGAIEILSEMGDVARKLAMDAEKQLDNELWGNK